jgi:hypothetical protein
MENFSFSVMKFNCCIVNFLTVLSMSIMPISYANAQYCNGAWYANQASILGQPFQPNQNIIVSGRIPDANTLFVTVGGTIYLYVLFGDWDVELCPGLPPRQSQKDDAVYRIDFQVNNINFGGFDDGMGNIVAQTSIVSHIKNATLDVNNVPILYENSSPAILQTLAGWAGGNIVVTATINDITAGDQDPDVITTFTLQPSMNACPNNMQRIDPFAEMVDFEPYNPGGSKPFTYLMLPLGVNYTGLVVTEEFIPYDNAILQEIEQEFFTLLELKRRFRNKYNINNMLTAVETIFRIGTPNSFAINNNNRFTDTHSSSIFQRQIYNLKKVFRNNIQQNQQGQNPQRFIGFKFRQRFNCGVNPIIPNPANQLATIRKRIFYDNNNIRVDQIFKTHAF